MNYFKHKVMALIGVATLLWGATACQDEGYEDVSGTASQTLWEVIKSRQDLSQFAQVLQQNGFDEILSSSGNYTVLAPGNSQMSTIDSDKLSEVPGAHIAPLSYNKTTLDGMEYLTMYNGRQALLSELKLTDEEIVCRNGFLRFSQGSARVTQQNIYEILATLADKYDMAAFITSLGDSIMDTEASVQVGIDPNTNQPIYDTVMTYFNPLFEYVPYNDNDSLISILLVDNDTWSALTNKYSRYMRKHVEANGNERLLDPTKDANVGWGNKFDTAATLYNTHVELVKDLSFTYNGATLAGSVNNAGEVGQVYNSRSGIEVNMDSAMITETLLAANGRIEVASGVKIKLTNNKIKDVYVEAEDYYYSNESYVATLIDPRFRGSRYVKTYGIDSLRAYNHYVLDSDGQRLKAADGTDSIEHVDPQLRYVYSTSQYAGRAGGSVLGYKVDLYSCNYRIQWRHVVPGNQNSAYATVDTLDVNYPNYVEYGLQHPGEDNNYPIGGVMRHIQKLYLSQPGDYALKYNSNLNDSDFVLHPYPYNSLSDFSFYRCMTDYDPNATIATSLKLGDEVGAPSKFWRMGINAGVGLDQMDYETPLIWCETYKDHADGVINDDPDGTSTTDYVYCSGITGVSSVTSWNINKTTGIPRRVPRDIFMCLYKGEATVFVTSNPFGKTNTAGAANLANLKGSIFLDYIHFIPVIDEDD